MPAIAIPLTSTIKRNYPSSTAKQSIVIHAENRPEKIRSLFFNRGAVTGF